MRRSTRASKSCCGGDEYIPEPVRDVDKPFMMSIEDVFSIKGAGRLVTGRIDRGLVKVSDPVELVGLARRACLRW